MQSSDQADQILNGVEEMGIRVAIDDFGVGHSSLSRLKDLRSHTLKLDSSFVEGLPHSSKDASIAQAVIALAESLGMESLAEGVESREQRDFLLEIGCSYGQGYFFSPPVDAAEIERLLAADHRWEPESCRPT